VPLRCVLALLRALSPVGGTAQDRYLQWGTAVLRFKGLVSIKEAPLARVYIGLSGRCRALVEEDGIWEGRGHTTVVALGPLSSVADAQRRVEELLSSTQEKCSCSSMQVLGACVACSTAAVQAAEQLVAMDSRFDWVCPLHKDDEIVLRVRLTCAKPMSTTTEELHLRHGLDLDKVNRALGEEVNGGIGEHGSCVWVTREEEGGSFSCVWCPLEHFEHTWPVLQQSATGVVQRFYSNIRNCSCGV
jgi:hypothetical protein